MLFGFVKQLQIIVPNLAVAGIRTAADNLNFYTFFSAVQAGKFGRLV